VIGLFSLKPDDLYRQGRARRISQARSVFCYWAVRELRLPQKALADRFSVTEPAITYAVGREQKIADENGYRLREE
jgi:putative transposase